MADILWLGFCMFVGAFSAFLAFICAFLAVEALGAIVWGLLTLRDAGSNNFVTCDWLPPDKSGFWD